MIKKVVVVVLVLLSAVFLQIVLDEMGINNIDRDEVDERFGLHSTFVHNDIGSLGELIAKRKKIRFLLWGKSDLVQCKQVILSLSFMSNEACEKDVAMQLAQSLMTEWWSLMLADPHYLSYLDGLRETGRHTDFYFEPRRFGLKLSFWDDKVRRRPEPYVSQIRVCDGKIYCYYRQKDNEALQEPTVETFEEAGWIFENVPPIPSRV